MHWRYGYIYHRNNPAVTFIMNSVWWCRPTVCESQNTKALVGSCSYRHIACLKREFSKCLFFLIIWFTLVSIFISQYVFSILLLHAYIYVYVCIYHLWTCGDSYSEHLSVELFQKGPYLCTFCMSIHLKMIGSYSMFCMTWNAACQKAA